MRGLYFFLRQRRLAIALVVLLSNLGLAHAVDRRNLCRHAIAGDVISIQPSDDEFHLLEERQLPPHVTEYSAGYPRHFYASGFKSPFTGAVNFDFFLVDRNTRSRSALISGKRAFDRILENFGIRQDKVSLIVGIWLRDSDDHESINFSRFVDQLERSPELDAKAIALQTWTGQQANRLGFSEVLDVEIMRNSIGEITKVVAFFAPEKDRFRRIVKNLGIATGFKITLRSGYWHESAAEILDDSPDIEFRKQSLKESIFPVREAMAMGFDLLSITSKPILHNGQMIEEVTLHFMPFD